MLDNKQELTKSVFIKKIESLCTIRKIDIEDLLLEAEKADELKQQWKTPNDRGNIFITPKTIVNFSKKLNVSCDYLLIYNNCWEEDIYEDFTNKKDNISKLYIVNKNGLPSNYPDVAVFYFDELKNNLFPPVITPELCEMLSYYEGLSAIQKSDIQNSVKNLYNSPSKVAAAGGVQNEEIEPPIEEITT